VKSSRMLFPTLVALSLAALLSGCGQTSTPTGVTALDETAPAAPSQLAKQDDTATPSGWLTWEPSTSANVASYEIYQYSPDPSREDAYLLVGQTDAATTRYALPVTSTPLTVYYRLRAVSTAGIRSPSSATGGIVVYTYSYGGEDGVDEPGADLPLRRPLINP
jgi:hypothetical protein